MEVENQLKGQLNGTQTHTDSVDFYECLLRHKCLKQQQILNNKIL